MEERIKFTGPQLVCQRLLGIRKTIEDCFSEGEDLRVCNIRLRKGMKRDVYVLTYEDYPNSNNFSIEIAYDANIEAVNPEIKKVLPVILTQEEEQIDALAKAIEQAREYYDFKTGETYALKGQKRSISFTDNRIREMGVETFFSFSASPNHKFAYNLATGELTVTLNDETHIKTDISREEKYITRSLITLAKFGDEVVRHIKK